MKCYCIIYYLALNIIIMSFKKTKAKKSEKKVEKKLENVKIEAEEAAELVEKLS